MSHARPWQYENKLLPRAPKFVAERAKARDEYLFLLSHIEQIQKPKLAQQLMQQKARLDGFLRLRSNNRKKVIFNDINLSNHQIFSRIQQAPSVINNQ